MRIIAGAQRGRRLAAPAGLATRPTAQRMRQAIFDMLMHAPWAGRALMEGAQVLDAFAGTGALGLEALSRGAAHASFMERDRAALASLRENVAACARAGAARILACDALRPPPGPAQTIIFLDPPYGANLVPEALRGLAHAGWISPETVCIAETERLAPPPDGCKILAQKEHGAAQVIVWRGVS